jgi:zinc protease
MVGEIKKEILPNGIVLVHKYNPEVPTVAVSMFLKMGSVYEPAKVCGISNLLQSTIIKGTSSRSASKISEEIESVGGAIKSDSTYDYSEISISISNKYFEKSIEILADVFFNPTFPQEEIIKEKLITLAEIKSRQEHIHDVAEDILFPNLYGKEHPYSKLDIGTYSTIKSISRKDIIAWWKKFYGIDRNVGNNIILSVVGDVEFDAAKENVLKYFSQMPSVEIPSLDEVRISQRSGLIRVKKHFKQAYLMYGYVAPRVSKENIKNYLSLKILNTYLGSGMSSKLFDVLRERNALCYETSSYYPARLLSSHFVIYIGLDTSKIDIAKKNIESIIYGLKTQRICNEELEMVKQKIKGQYLLDHQTNIRQAWYLGYWEILGLGCDYDDKFIEQVYSISAEDILNVAKSTFSNSPTIVEILSSSGG